MGISLAIALPASVLLGAFFLLRNTAPWIVLAPLLHSSIVGFMVALFAHPAIDNPLILFKSSSGDFPLWSYIAFFPYFVGTRLYVQYKKSRSNQALFTEICDGLFVGGWPVRTEDLPAGKPAIVDCTNELPRSACVHEELPYLCIPSWDTRSPSPESIELAVRWAMDKRGQNHPILIHCAKGHGRSVAVMCALLAALGVVSDWREGEVLVKRHRANTRLNAAQKRSLQAWQQQYRRSS